MFHDPRYWATRVPTSLFEQTQYEADQLFYATFPAARDAASLKKITYDLPTPVDCPTFYEAIQPLIYDSDIRNELEINSSTSVSFRDPTQELLYPQSHIDCRKGLYPQQSFVSHHQSQPSNFSPCRPIEKDAPVYLPPKQVYRHQFSSEPTPQYIPQSHPGHPSPVATRKDTFATYQPSNISPPVNTDIQETVGDDCRDESPRYSFRQLNRHMKPPTSTLKFNNSRLGVMRLDRLWDSSCSHLDSPEHCGQLHPSPTETLHVSRPSTSPPTEFLLKSPKSPSIGLSSLPSMDTLEKKPALACHFCRGRKIRCGTPLPESIKKTSNAGNEVKNAITSWRVDVE